MGASKREFEKQRQEQAKKEREQQIKLERLKLDNYGK